MKLDAEGLRELATKARDEWPDLKWDWFSAKTMVDDDGVRPTFAALIEAASPTTILSLLAPQGPSCHTRGTWLSPPLSTTSPSVHRHSPMNSQGFGATTPQAECRTMAP